MRSLRGLSTVGQSKDEDDNFSSSAFDCLASAALQNQSPHSTAEGEGSSEEDNELDGRVEKILAPAKGSIDVENRRFVVKLHERSYRAVKTVSESVLMEHCPQLMRNYLVKVNIRPGLSS
jgi:hypothetical protein